MAGDPYWNNVIFATHGEAWGDLKNGVWPTFGATSPSITTSQKIFGSGSFALSSITSGWAQWDVDPTQNFGSQNFTIDLWVRTSSINGIICRCKGVKIYIDNANLYAVVGDTSLAPGAAARIRSMGWKHIAIERYGGVLTAYFDGAIVAQTTIGAVDIGGQDWPYVSLNGYSGNIETGAGGNIDECRVTMGAARYKGAFSLATEAFPEYYEAPVVSNVIFWD